MVDPIPNDLSAFGKYAPKGIAALVLRATRRCKWSWRGRRSAFFLRAIAVKVLRGRPLDVEAFGAKMRLYPYNNVCEKRILFTPQFFDPAERDAIESRIGTDSVFIDIGANIGGYTLSCAAHAGPRARILAIEPQPEIFERLVFNIRQNPFANVKAIDCAVADRDGEITLFVDARNRGETSMRIVHSDAVAAHLRVPAKTLASIVREEGFTRIDAIKLDVEGAEDLILEPFLAETSEDLWPTLIVIEKSGDRWSVDLPNLLRDHGFREIVKTRNNIIYERPRNAAVAQSRQKSRSAVSRAAPTAALPVIFNLMLSRGPGGLERAAAHYHRALTSRGYRVVTLGHPKGWLRSELPADALFEPLTALTYYDPRGLFDLERALRKHQPAVVLAHGNRAMRYASRARRSFRVGVLHNLRFKTETGRLDAVIAVSRAVAEAARGFYPDLPVEMVPNLVEMDTLASRPARRDPVVIGALGRLHVDKGFDVLFEALGSPRLVARSWRLIIGGEGPEHNRLMRLAAKLGIAERVTFSGWIGNLSTFFESIDLLAMPSRTETFPLVLIEALANAVPVVTSNTAGTREIAEPDREALIVPIEDSQALARGIETLIDDERLAAELASRGCEHVTSAYTFPVVAARLDHVLRDLMGRQRGAGESAQDAGLRLTSVSSN